MFVELKILNDFELRRSGMLTGLAGMPDLQYLIHFIRRTSARSIYLMILPVIEEIALKYQIWWL